MRFWGAVCEAKTSRALGAILRQLRVSGVEGDRVVVVPDASVAKMAASKLEEIERHVSQVAGRSVRVVLDEPGEVEAVGGGGDEGEEEEGASVAQDPSAVANDPVVRRAVELFGARIVSVEPKVRGAREGVSESSGGDGGSGDG